MSRRALCAIVACAGLAAPLGSPQAKTGVSDGSHVAALEATARSLDRGGVPWALSQRDLCRAYLARSAGDRADDIERAIAACQAALPVLDQPETRSEWANTQLILAGAWHDRLRGDGADNLQTAIAADRAALTTLSPASEPGLWAAAQANLCHDLSEQTPEDRPEDARQDVIEAAITACEAAATVMTPTSSPGAWRTLITSLAPLYADRASGDRAANQEHAIALLRQAVDSPEAKGASLAAANLRLGEIFRRRVTGGRRANLEAAVRYEQQALLGEPLDDRWPILVGRALGEDLIALGRYQEASDALLIASRAAEAVIGLGLEEAQERSVLDDVRDVYTLSAYAAAQAGDARRALALVSAGKARLLFTALSADNLDLSPTEETELNRDRGEILRREALLEQSAVAGASAPPVAAAALKDLDAVKRREIALYEKGTRDRLAQPPASKVVTQGALMALVVTELGTELLVATPGGAVSAFAAPDVTRATLDRLVNGPEDPAAPGGGWRRARGGREISEGLAEVQPALGAGLGAAIRRALEAAGVKPGSPVMIMPDGASALLPLSLASDPHTGRTLLEDYEISFTPSLAALAASHRRIVRTASKSLGLLRPPPGAALAYAPIEGELVAARFDTSRLTAWDGAEKTALLKGLEPRTYWHFATHGGFDWKDPRRSGLLIGDHLALLQLSDLLEAHGRIGAPRLVVLSACDSGLSDIDEDPDEFTGLPMGFIFAGAAGVVASSWPVNDLSTTLLMGRFYDLHLGAGEAPARALRAAELWLKGAPLAELEGYVAAKRDSGVLSAGQAQAIMAALERFARATPAGAPVFASPRYWGAFSVYGE